MKSTDAFQMTLGLRTLLAVIILSGSAEAQERHVGGVLQSLERPGHASLMALVARPETTLAPFETDGCSGGLSSVWQAVANQFPDFTEVHQSTPPWEDCCVTHDKAYHDANGALEAQDSFEARLTADIALRACVISTGTNRSDTIGGVYGMRPDQVQNIYAGIAEAMYLAVRIGGLPCSGLPWRWGYGYPSC